jgi:protein SCO1/2
MKSGARTQPAWLLSFAVASLLLWLGACGSQPAPEQAAEPAEGGPERHALHGRVISVDPQGNSLVVDHDEIPDFMGAMAMPYPVRDAAELENVEAGDEVNAEVVVDDSGMYLENIVVAGEGQ